MLNPRTMKVDARCTTTPGYFGNGNAYPKILIQATSSVPLTTLIASKANQDVLEASDRPLAPNRPDHQFEIDDRGASYR